MVIFLGRASGANHLYMVARQKVSLIYRLKIGESVKNGIFPIGLLLKLYESTRTHIHVTQMNNYKWQNKAFIISAIWGTDPTLAM